MKSNKILMMDISYDAAHTNDVKKGCTYLIPKNAVKLADFETRP